MCDNLQDLFEGKIELLVINVPPQSGKTEIITKLFPVWCIGNDNNFKTIATGYSAMLTTSFSEQARNYYTSNAYKQIFPDSPELTKNGAENWGNDFVSYKSAGVGGTITGKGCDLCLIDDPLNPNDVVTSSVTMDKANVWFSNVARTRLSPTGKKIMCIIMQRLHDNDLTGYVLRRFKKRFDSGKWKHIEIDAELDENGNKGSFFEKLFNQKYLSEKRDEMTTDKGANYYAAQYRQNPIDIENSEFKRKYFKYYTEENKPRFVKGYIAIDPAISEKQTADNSAISVVAQDQESNFYRRHSFHGRVSPDKLIDEIFKIQSAYQYPVVIEAISFQRILTENIRKEMIIRGQMFSIIEIKTRGEKNARIRSTLQPLYSSGRIYHLMCDEFSDFENELLRFPKGQHDDEIDAFETAISQFSIITRPQNNNTQRDNYYDGFENSVLGLV
jgi:predicted phage terminase large subunit-like protein